MMNKSLISGVLSTPMTPFTDDGKLDLGVIEPFVAWQAEQGVSGFYVLGTWGGFAVQSIEERKLVAEAYAKASQKYGMQLIVHIAAHAWEDTLGLGRHAIDLGVTAISATVPGYYSTGGYLRMEDYKRYFSGLVEQLNCPLFVYNNPRTTNVLFEPNEFVELVKVGVTGVKDGSKNIAWILKAQNQLCDQGLSAEIISGNSVGLLYSFLYGCNAVTSGAAVVFPSQTVKVPNLLNAGDLAGAAEQHRFVLKLREAMSLCSAAPSAAHYLLQKLQLPTLGYPRSIWPKVDRVLAAKIDLAISRIL
jgi:dihydrodipicolinate synthase/N-acetylneuraminate lyase